MNRIWLGTVIMGIGLVLPARSAEPWTIETFSPQDVLHHARMAAGMKEPPPVLRAADPWLIEQYRRDLYHSNWNRRRDAARALGNCGIQALHAYSDLVRVSVKDADSDVRNAAIQAAVTMERYGAPVEQVAGLLSGFLYDSSWRIRRDAAEKLASFGPRAVAVYSALMQVSMVDSDQDVRNSAARAVDSIGVYGGHVEAVAGSLARLLYDSSWEVRQRAANRLGSFGIRAVLAYPALVQVSLLDSDGDVRNSASAAAIRMEHEGAVVETVVSSIIPILYDRTWQTRQRAANKLGSFGPRAQAAYAALVRVGIEDSDTDVRASAAAAAQRVRGYCSTCP